MLKVKCPTLRLCLKFLSGGFLGDHEKVCCSESTEEANTKAWARIAVKPFITTRKGSLRMKNWVRSLGLGTCSQHVVTPGVTLTQPVCKSYIWLIHCLCLFHLWKVKTQKSMLLASGNLDQSNKIKRQSKKEKKNLSYVGPVSEQTSPAIGRGTSTRHKYIFRIPPEGLLNVFFFFFSFFLFFCVCVRQFLHLHIPLITFFLITKVMHILCKDTWKQQKK